VVTVPADNVGNVSIAGLDFESDYTRHVWGGSVTGRLVANYLLKVNQPTAVTGCAFTDVLGAVGGCLGANGYPRWKGSLSGQYQRGRAGIFIQERVIDSAKADPWSVVGTTITRNAIPMIEYTDLNFSYAVGFADRGKAYLQVSNLFNRNPPVTITRAAGSIPPPAANVYDLLGRRFVLGYRFTF
jgi:outer membrane receptor protein involved in Fe transport